MNNSFWNVKKLVAKYIINIFKQSGKKNLIITGSINSGKSSLAYALLDFLAFDYKIESIFKPKEYVKISFNGKVVDFAYFDKKRPELKMICKTNADTSLAESVLDAYNYNQIFIDEIGYLEENTVMYQNILLDLFDKKMVLAVIRKQDSTFLNKLKALDNTYLLDLDTFILPIGAVVMASGVSKRFGSNKHLVDYKGKKLIDYTIDNANLDIFKEKVLLTRNTDTFNYSKDKINSIKHDLEYRSLSTALGVKTLEDSDIFGIIFLQADQPNLSYDTLFKMCNLFSKRPDMIIQAKTIDGNSSPVIFPRSLFKDLKKLEGKSGGKAVINNNLDKVIFYEISSYEAFDIDTPLDLTKY